MLTAIGFISNVEREGKHHASLDAGTLGEVMEPLLLVVITDVIPCLDQAKSELIRCTALIHVLVDLMVCESRVVTPRPISESLSEKDAAEYLGISVETPRNRD